MAAWRRALHQAHPRPRLAAVLLAAATLGAALSMAGAYAAGADSSPVTVTGVSPAAGLTTGGTDVTITGTDLSGATAVQFGMAPSTAFTVESPTTIVASAPAQAAGTVDVTVTAPDGTSSPSAADQFTYEAGDLAWTPEAPATSPPARTVYGMTTDQNGDVILLGGDAGHGSAIGDFWKYTEPGGVPTWTKLTPAHTPWGLVGASGLADAQMRLDPVSGNVIAFGGTAYTGNFNDTWSWNGTDWSLLHPQDVPSARSEYGMDIDPTTGHIMIEGGWPHGPTFSAMDNDTWEWSGTDWVQENPAHSPSPRAGAVMVGDPSRGIVVLFGGHNGSNADPYAQILGDTWTWNGTDWTQQTPAHAPSPREYSDGFYDPALQMVVVCGGDDNTQGEFDCWGWNGSDWVQVSQDQLSDVGDGASIVYSAKLGKAVTFGGWPSINGSPDAETWSLATQVPAPGIAPVQFGDAVATSAGKSTSLTVDVGPTGAGDQLAAVVAVHAPKGTKATITPPAGWTTVGSGGTNGSPVVGVYTDAGAPTGTTAVTFTCAVSSGSVVAGGVVTEFRGVSTSGAESAAVVGTGATGQSALATGPPVAVGQVAVAAFATDVTSRGSGLTSAHTPSGWGPAGDQADGLSADGMDVWAYWQPGTGTAPSAAMAWTDTGGALPYTTAMASLGGTLATPPPVPTPTVTGVSPSAGSTAGGTTVTVNGTNLAGASAVTFGTVTGTNVVVNGAGTSLTVTDPAESAGPVDVTVTTPGGPSATGAADQFTYITPTPTVTGVSPSVGSTAGGTTVTVNGTNLAGASAVTFGTATGTNVVVNGAGTSLTVTDPAESAGPVDVTVTTPGGPSATSAPDQFTYTTSAAATISAVGPLADTMGSTTSLAVSPQAVGDVLVVIAERASGSSLRSVSGGGVSSWSKATSFAGSTGAEEEIWFGKVTATGRATITFTWSTSISHHNAEYASQEFSAGAGASTVWSLDQSGTRNATSGTTVPFPSLTPTSPGELYVGYSVPNDNASAGSTPGFTYKITPQDNIVAYDASVSGAVAPTGSQSPASQSSSLAVLLRASP